VCQLREKPITWLETGAEDIIQELAVSPDPLILTQRGEAVLVLMSISEYENHQQMLALLKLMAIGRQELAHGKFSDAEQFLQDMDH